MSLFRYHIGKSNHEMTLRDVMPYINQEYEIYMVHGREMLRYAHVMCRHTQRSLYVELRFNVSYGVIIIGVVGMLP
mgnify:CR=1 FL=1